MDSFLPSSFRNAAGNDLLDSNPARVPCTFGSKVSMGYLAVTVTGWRIICSKRSLTALLLPMEDHWHCLWNELMENWNNSSSIAPSLRVGHPPITRFHRTFGLFPQTIAGQSLPLLNLSLQ